jgi:hypothetical protein
LIALRFPPERRLLRDRSRNRVASQAERGMSKPFRVYSLLSICGLAGAMRTDNGEPFASPNGL